MSQDSLDAQFPHIGYDAFSPFAQSIMGAGSPPATTSQSPMPVVIGSVDSGLGGDGMEGLMRDTSGPGSNSGARTTRGSSEEKENGLTPAQSRRKAQNRAAYVFFFSFLWIRGPRSPKSPSVFLYTFWEANMTTITASGPSVSARNATSANSRHGCRPLSRRRRRCSRTTSGYA